jgi:hypothetical protein
MSGRTLVAVLVVAVAAAIAGCERGPLEPGDSVRLISITNPQSQLAQGQTYCFAAQVVTATSVTAAVTWQARHGARNGVLTADGCYRADSLGADTVTAMSLVDPTKSASVAFVVVPPTPWPLGALLDLAVPTYDSSGQAIHPSELHFPHGFGGWDYWSAATPYPFTNAAYENPSVFVSSDGLHWLVQPGASNPLVLPGVAHQSPAAGSARYYTGIQDGSWSTLSDPDLVYDSAANVLRLYFRQVGQNGEYVFLMQTGDGTDWSQPRTVMAADPVVGGDLISPTFVHRDDRWESWFVKGNCGAQSSRVETASSLDGITGWSQPAAVSIAQPGYVIWHIQVRYIANAYWALYSAYPSWQSDCFSGDLFLADSPDGITWTTFSRPILSHAGFPDFASGFYRSSVIGMNGDTITLQVSGYYASGGRLASRVGTVKFDFAQLTSGLTPNAPASARQPRPQPQARPAFHSPGGDGEDRLSAD